MSQGCPAAESLLSASQLLSCDGHCAVLGVVLYWVLECDGHCAAVDSMQQYVLTCNRC